MQKRGKLLTLNFVYTWLWNSLCSNRRPVHIKIMNCSFLFSISYLLCGYFWAFMFFLPVECEQYIGLFNFSLICLLRFNNCFAPQSSVHADFNLPRCINSLMTSSAYFRNNKQLSSLHALRQSTSIYFQEKLGQSMLLFKKKNPSCEEIHSFLEENREFNASSIFARKKKEYRNYNDYIILIF